MRKLKTLGGFKEVQQTLQCNSIDDDDNVNQNLCDIGDYASDSQTQFNLFYNALFKTFADFPLGENMKRRRWRVKCSVFHYSSLNVSLFNEPTPKDGQLLFNIFREMKRRQRHHRKKEVSNGNSTSKVCIFD